MGVLQCVACCVGAGSMCCSVLQCDTVCCSVLHVVWVTFVDFVLIPSSMDRRTGSMCCSMLRVCDAVCCSEKHTVRVQHMV